MVNTETATKKTNPELNIPILAVKSTNTSVKTSSKESKRFLVRSTTATQTRVFGILRPVNGTDVETRISMDGLAIRVLSDPHRVVFHLQLKTSWTKPEPKSNAKN